MAIGWGRRGSSSRRHYPLNGRLVIPLYVYPSFGGSAWNTVENSPNGVRAIIANPATGPGVSSNSDYVREIAAMQAKAVKVYGYVNTQISGNIRTQSLVTTDVDNWFTWYNVDGIFYDLTPTGVNGDQTAYLQTICNYARAKKAGSVAYVNPGTWPLAVGYLDAADATCVWEGDFSANNYLTSTVPTYASAYAAQAASKLWHLVYGVPAQSLGAALNHAINLGVGIFYATDEAGGLWGTLAGFYAAQTALVQL